MQQQEMVLPFVLLEVVDIAVGIDDAQRKLNACTLQAVALVETEKEVVEELVHRLGQRRVDGFQVQQQRVGILLQRIALQRVGLRVAEVHETPVLVP